MLLKVCVVGGRSGTLMGRIVRDVRERMDGRGQYRGKGVLFVPEQYTLQGERDLIRGLGTDGLLEMDVVSPTKWKSLIRERAGFSGKAELDKLGRGLAVHKAMRDREGELRYFRDMAGLFGSVEGMDNTLREMKESGLSPEELYREAEASAMEGDRAKYTDLGLIWEQYEALIEERFEDTTDAWTDACRRLGESRIWEGADLWIYGFDMIRPDLREMIYYAAGVCRRVTVLMTMTPETAPDGRVFRLQRESAEQLTQYLAARGVRCRTEYMTGDRDGRPEALRFLERNLYAERQVRYSGDPAGEISLFTASHPTAEASRVVSELCEWHDKGVPWGRMAVVMPPESMVENALAASLRANGIPFFMNRKYPAIRHGVCRLLRGALQCVRKGYRTEYLTEMAECGFGPLNREEGAELESYAASNGIEFGKWKKPFTRGKNAERAEALRLRLTEPVEALHGRLAGAKTGRESAEAMVFFLEETGVWEQLRERQGTLTEKELHSEAVIDRQIWDNIMNMLDRLTELTGDRRVNMSDVTDFAVGALERSTLQSIPEREEGIALGEIGHMLPGQTDVLAICGAVAGAMDPGGNDLLTEADRHILEERIRELAEKSGTIPVRLGMNPETRAILRRFDFYRTMNLPEKHLMVSWSLKSEEGEANQPGEPVLRLKRLFPLLEEEGGIYAEGVPKHPRTPGMAMEGLCYLLRLMKDGEMVRPNEEWDRAFVALYRSPEYRDTMMEMVRLGLGWPDQREIEPDTAMALYDRKAVSITRLENFAGCPYRHFVQYGLRPVVPEEWKFTAKQAGDFYHGVMEQYIRTAKARPDWPGLSEEQVNEILTPILADLTRDWAEGPLGESALGVWQGEAYLRRVRQAALTLTRFAANSDFEVVGTEITFGMGSDGLPPLRLENGDGTETLLQGKIDRLDEYRGTEGRYLRVLDLKSSGRKLNAEKWLRGESLQLPLYLKVAEEAMPGSTGAAALYFAMTDKEVNAADPDTAEEKRTDQLRMNGIVLAREEVIRAMDRDKMPYSIPNILNADGEVSKSAKWALKEDVLRGVTDASVKIAGRLCGRILSGEIHPAPTGNSQRSACTYCEFYPSCGRQPGDIREEGERMTFEQAVEKINAEEEGRPDESSANGKP